MKENDGVSNENLPPSTRGDDWSILKIRTSQKDRSVYSFLERVLPAATFLFAALILLQDHNRFALAILILGHTGFNISLSILISRFPQRTIPLLEGTKNVANAAYAAAVLWIGTSTFLWTLHFLPIARSMLTFRTGLTRIGMAVFFGLSAGAAEALAGGTLKDSSVPLVVLVAPTLLTEVLFQFFDRKLRQERDDRLRAEQALRLSGRMQAVGSLAAGLAHEINTPVQYVSDSLAFVREGIHDLLRLQQEYHQLAELVLADDTGLKARTRTIRELEQNVDADYLEERVPSALERMAEGLGRVADIVDSVRRISHPGTHTKKAEDLNEAIRATVRVTTSAWKDVAEIHLALGELPRVDCNLGELHQVFLNLLVNSADAIREKRLKSSGGFIKFSTVQLDSEVEIRVTDNGCGIPPEHIDRVFDPFFTTKIVGSGTGQGLAIARTVVCDHHRGTIHMESHLGQGAEAVIRLPLQQRDPDHG